MKQNSPFLVVRPICILTALVTVQSGCSVNRSAINSDMDDERIELIVRERLNHLPSIREKALEAIHTPRAYMWHGLRVGYWNESASEIRIPLSPKRSGLYGSAHFRDAVVRLDAKGQVRSVRRQKRIWAAHVGAPDCWTEAVYVPFDGIEDGLRTNRHVDDTDEDPWRDSQGEARRKSIRVILDAEGSGEFKLKPSQRYISLVVVAPGMNDGKSLSVSLDSGVDFVITAQSEGETRKCDWSGSFLPPNDLGFVRIPEYETSFCLRFVTSPHPGADFAVSLQREAAP